MTDPGADSELFHAITRQLLEQGMDVLFQARGASMSPAIRDGEIVQVTPVIVSKLRKDDIVLTKSKNGFRLHRIVFADYEKDLFVTRGDCGREDDAAVSGEEIVGMAVAKEVRVGRKVFRAKFRGAGGFALRSAARGQRILQKILGGADAAVQTSEAIASGRASRSIFPIILALLLVTLTATASHAQVAVDATTSTSADVAGTGTTAVTFSHTTTTTANRLMIIGVSISVTNSTGTTVSSVTYGTQTLTKLGMQEDAAPSRLVELWYVLAPASGTATVTVNVNVPTNNTVGVVVGATTFTDVDQTVPLGTFVSTSGESGACVTSANPTSACSSQLNVSSVVNGMVFDVFATGEAPTVTEYNPQVQQWNVASGTGGNRDVTGSSSTRSGAPSVPVSELLTSTSNWAQAGISINPSAADIGVTTSVASAVFVGQNTTYTTTVYNNGSSPANNVTLTDTWPTSMSVVSITPSSGTTCTAAPPPITCTLPTPFTSAMTATVTVVVTAGTSGAYTDTATVTDSGTPPDTNPSNNTYVSVATVQAVACAPATTATAGTGLTGTLNTYYPGTASVAAGATSIPVGTPTGAGAAIAKGDLLLVIQMQDASLNLSNTVTYGNGYTGQGFTNLNSAGDYEFVTAGGPVSGGSVPITGAGSGGGLVFAYHASAVSATAGQSTYQVIVVPQYTTASFNATTPPTALAWNGSTGGVLAIDTSAALNLNGATVVVDGMGFRGGAGMELNGGGTGTGADFLYPAPATYTGVAEAGVDGSKGEGIAGTPAWVESNQTYLSTGTGYPSGTAGTDGSSARGAPGNAGGGGTDPDQAGNTENAGGGGGGNGGAGGFGGNSWAANTSTGGEGGAAFPATINRIAMGGGGGAGDRNNSDGDNQASSAAAGGGIIIIRAYALTGTGTLTANGASAYNATANDAGGGGGAGGTIVVLSANGGESGLTLDANGGTGGNAWATETFTLGNRHGPGGGGGGGAIFVSGTPAAVSVTGAASGTTENPGVTYGSTSGANGTSVTNATITSTSGTLSGAQCTPDMTLGKSHLASFVRGSTATYLVPVSNVSPYGATNSQVTVTDILPLGVTPTSATGTGWSCAIAAQTVSCLRSDVLAGASSYPTITVGANISQSAPPTITNTATVAGGGEINLTNDSATDTGAVTSSADLSVTNVVSADPVTAGNDFTYTQVVTNNGPSAADNATLIDPIPANATLLSITPPAGWSCITPGGPGNIVCTNSNMAGSTSGTFTLLMNLTSGTASGTVISQTASVSSAVADPNLANNTATATTVVGTTPKAELTVTNVASPNPVQVGGSITYTQVVTNSGSAATSPSATFTEATPTNTTFSSITPPAGWTCSAPPVSCTNTTGVAAGSSAAFSVVYTVNAGTANGTSISDTATVNAANQAFGANSTVATDVVAGAAQADLVLTTVATPNSLLAGNSITYTQTITNNGPAAATSLTFTETEPTPADTTFQSVSAPAGWVCTTPAVGATGTITCTDASLAVGASADIIVVANVPSATAAGTFTTTSSVSATSSVATSTTATTTSLFDLCDLSVTDSGTPNPVLAAGTLTYTQTVTNLGPSACTTGKFNEATPAGTTFASVAVTTTGGGTWTCPNVAPVACTNPSVPPGSIGTITAKYTVTAAAGTLITDTVTASSSTKDSNAANNTASTSIAVAAAGNADLSMANSASSNPVTAGNNIIYTQTVTNLGPATAGSNTAASITVTETLPTGTTTAVGLSGPAGWSCSLTTLKCTNPANTTIALNGTAVFTFTVAIPAVTSNGTTITDMVSVADTTPTDPNTNNNSASVSVQVGDSANLQITDAASPVPVQAGNAVTYTQVVTNSGPSTAANVSLTDTLPPNTTATSLTAPGWTCTLATLTCTDSSFAVGSETVTFVATVNSGTAPGTAVNSTATVTSSTPDPNSANNTATATDVVATSTQADLSMSNTPSVSSIAAGGNVTYTQVITNLGPAATTAGTATLTEIIPANMTFQTLTPPTGWTCTTPSMNGTGTITCTANAGTSIALNGTASFSVVLQVVSTTASGTDTSDTVTASAGNVVPNLTTNSATATVLVANANSADMKIVKTATPNPVLQGDTLTYSLAVTNNGPASATNVTVEDTLPTEVTYLSSTTTTGTCSEAGGTVTCLLGTMANGGTATVTVLTVAGVAGVVSNTATVSADQTDPNLANNSSTQTETIEQPTSIQLQGFAAQLATGKNGRGQVLLTWRTGGEANNLGFNVYSERNGNRVRLNPSLIAGSALWMGAGLPKHAGKSYRWIDSSSVGGAGSYWLEDVDVNGTRTMHGPVQVEDAVGAASAEAPSAEPMAAQALMLNQLSQLNPSQPSAGLGSHGVETLPQAFTPSAVQIQKQFELAAHPAMKILVRHEGWYSVSQPDLVNAGLDPNVDPASLQLFVEAVEQPMQVNGATAGAGGFGPQASISFYGTAIDTQYSGTRVYWLAAGNAGARIQQVQASSGANQPATSFSYTVEVQPRTIYFAALITPDGNNFFGPLISTTPTEQAMQTPNFDPSSIQPSTMDVVLQGVIKGIPHDVSVAVNGTIVGDVNFTGQDKGKVHLVLPPGTLQSGANTINLTAQNGEYDTSLIGDIRITYPHLYAADSDQLKFTGRAGDEVMVDGFTNGTIAVIDITDSANPVQLSPQITGSNGTYQFTVQVPWTTTAVGRPLKHTLFAVAADQVATVAGVRANHPSSWHSAQNGADVAMISHEDFVSALPLLVAAHQAAGKSSVVIPVGDLYDEFNFGERSPYAIRQFLQTASVAWRIKPKYLLLNGRASLDPRNYLGFGYLDYVPTKIIPGVTLMTASDDWLSDFHDRGMPSLATGRLPVTTLAEANTVVSKIAAYEGQSTNGAWTASALMVADKDDSSDNFTQDSQTVQAELPSTLQVTDVFAGTAGPTAARQEIVSAINSGQLLVNYLGHGSEDQWAGDDIFDNNTASALTNGSQLPVFFIMDCLNGFFQDVYDQPLSVALLLAPNGGGVAVLASSGLNQATPQVNLDALVVKAVLNSSRPTLGDVILAAKSQISAVVVRKTYNLLGDPAMQVKSPVPAN